MTAALFRRRKVKQLPGPKGASGLMSFSYTSYAVGSDGLLSFSGKMSLQNDTPAGSGALRVRLVEVATANFRDDAGPPDLSGYPPATPLETTIGSVSPLAPGTSQEVAISAKVRSTIKLDPEGRQWVNFHVYAILDQDVGGTWVPVDSRKLAEGVKGKAFRFRRSRWRGERPAFKPLGDTTGSLYIEFVIRERSRIGEPCGHTPAVYRNRGATGTPFRR
jgi:hypothetical protein